MNCPICAASLPASSAFCPACGARVDGTAPASASTDPASGNRSSATDQFRDRAGKGDLAERDLWSGRYSPKAMIGTLLMVGVATIIAIVAAVFLGQFTPWNWYIALGVSALMWLIVGTKLLVRVLGVAYRLTNQRFYHEVGILRKVINRIEVIDMDDVTTSQGLLDRMVNVGKIKVTSSDRTHPELWLDGIENVRNVAEMLDSARRAERVRRGLHIESI
jgi:membrane protein YdbS with pleckstrin-like domain